jgi:hypothetical protein
MKQLKKTTLLYYLIFILLGIFTYFGIKLNNNIFSTFKMDNIISKEIQNITENNIYDISNNLLSNQNNINPDLYKKLSNTVSSKFLEIKDFGKAEKFLTGNDDIYFFNL